MTASTQPTLSVCACCADPNTGGRQVIASDPLLFNFPVKLQFLPPVLGASPLVVASDQEYRLAAINALLTTDVLQPPWIIAKVLLFAPHHLD
jgi:hypothetical protein